MDKPEMFLKTNILYWPFSSLFITYFVVHLTLEYVEFQKG